MKKALLTVGIALVIAPAFGQSPPGSRSLVEPAFSASDFGHPITNKYFTLKPGAKFVYEEKTNKGVKRVEIEVTGEARQVMGISATVLRDREWVDGELQEDTRDWFAQDKAGNVWYFGEAVDNYEGGKLVNHDGSWEAGLEGAKPGIIMLNDPKVGDTYRQEYLAGKAEDMGTVVAVRKKVTVPHGTFDDCVQIQDWSRIKESETEYKCYCSGVGYMVLEEEGPEKLELVSASTK